MEKFCNIYSKLVKAFSGGIMYADIIFTFSIAI